jgi:hypothetical protein
VSSAFPRVESQSSGDGCAWLSKLGNLYDEVDFETYANMRQ